jgi:hypothetical protein
MVPSPVPLSKRNEGHRADAIFEYSSNGLAEGAGRVRIRGEGELCRNGIDEGKIVGIGGGVFSTRTGDHYTVYAEAISARKAL